MRRTSWALIGALLGGTGLLGGTISCAGELRGDPASYKVTRASSGACDALPVFARRCGSAGCHTAGSSAAGLDLKSAGLPARLVGVVSKSMGCESRLLVDPRDTGKSFLLEKLDKTSPACGDPMPLVGSITPDELACIHTWVQALSTGGGDGGVTSGADASPQPGPDAGARAQDAGGQP